MKPFMHSLMSSFVLSSNIFKHSILLVFVFSFSSILHANENEERFRVLYLYYPISDPDQVEYAFTTTNYQSASDCDQGLASILKVQKNKVGSLIKSYRFKKNWTEFGGESYLVINRLDDLRQLFMCKNVD